MLAALVSTRAEACEPQAEFVNGGHGWRKAGGSSLRVPCLRSWGDGAGSVHPKLGVGPFPAEAQVECSLGLRLSPQAAVSRGGHTPAIGWTWLGLEELHMDTGF